MRQHVNRTGTSLDHLATAAGLALGARRTHAGADADALLGRLADTALDVLRSAPADPSPGELADAIEQRPAPAAPTAGALDRPLDRPQVVIVESIDLEQAALAKVLTDGGCDVVGMLRSGLTVPSLSRDHGATVIVANIDLPPAGTWSGLMMVASILADAKPLHEVPLPVIVLLHPAHGALAGRAIKAGATQVLARANTGALVKVVRDAHREYMLNVQAAYPAGGAGDRHAPDRPAGGQGGNVEG